MARFTFSALRLTLIAIALIVAARHVLAAPEHSGQVTFGGLPVPGATVTASAGDKQLVTATDEQGLFKFADVGDGVWILRVEMLGFAPLSREVTVAPDTPSTWTLVLKPFDEITRGLPPRPATAPGSAQPSALSPSAGSPSAGNAGRAAPAAPAAGRGGFQRAGVTASPTPPAAAATLRRRCLAGAAADASGRG